MSIDFALLFTDFCLFQAIFLHYSKIRLILIKKTKKNRHTRVYLFFSLPQKENMDYSQ